MVANQPFTVLKKGGHISPEVYVLSVLEIVSPVSPPIHVTNMYRMAVSCSTSWCHTVDVFNVDPIVFNTPNHLNSLPV